MRMGRLFLASHRSLQHDYEVSAEELDFLVDTAAEFSGVYGCRMTGGGFGGCTVNLVAPERVELFETHIAEAYRRAFHRDVQIYRCEPAAGAGEVNRSATAGSAESTAIPSECEEERRSMRRVRIPPRCALRIVPRSSGRWRGPSRRLSSGIRSAVLKIPNTWRAY